MVVGEKSNVIEFHTEISAFFRLTSRQATFRAMVSLQSKLSIKDQSQRNSRNISNRGMIRSSNRCVYFVELFGITVNAIFKKIVSAGFDRWTYMKLEVIHTKNICSRYYGTQSNSCTKQIPLRHDTFKANKFYSHRGMHNKSFDSAPTNIAKQLTTVSVH